MALPDKLRTDKKGATAVEYGLICAVIVVAIIGSINGLGVNVSLLWTDVAKKVANR